MGEGEGEEDRCAVELGRWVVEALCVVEAALTEPGWKVGSACLVEDLCVENGLCGEGWVALLVEWEEAWWVEVDLCDDLCVDDGLCEAECGWLGGHVQGGERQQTAAQPNQINQRPRTSSI